MFQSPAISSRWLGPGHQRRQIGEDAVRRSVREDRTLPGPLPHGVNRRHRENRVPADFGVRCGAQCPAGSTVQSVSPVMASNVTVGRGSSSTLSVSLATAVRQVRCPQPAVDHVVRSAGSTSSGHPELGDRASWTSAISASSPRRSRQRSRLARFQLTTRIISELPGAAGMGAAGFEPATSRV